MSAAGDRTALLKYQCLAADKWSQYPAKTDVDLACHSIRNIESETFCDGTYIGPGGSFDISSSHDIAIKSAGEITLDATRTIVAGATPTLSFYDKDASTGIDLIYDNTTNTLTTQWLNRLEITSGAVEGVEIGYDGAYNFVRGKGVPLKISQGAASEPTDYILMDYLGSGSGGTVIQCSEQIDLFAQGGVNSLTMRNNGSCNIIEIQTAALFNKQPIPDMVGMFTTPDPTMCYAPRLFTAPIRSKPNLRMDRHIPVGSYDIVGNLDFMWKLPTGDLSIVSMIATINAKGLDDSFFYYIEFVNNITSAIFWPAEICNPSNPCAVQAIKVDGEFVVTSTVSEVVNFQADIGDSITAKLYMMANSIGGNFIDESKMTLRFETIAADL